MATNVGVADQPLVQQECQLLGGALALQLCAREAHDETRRTRPYYGAFETAKFIDIENDRRACRRYDFAFDRRAAGRHVDDLAHRLAVVGGHEYAAAEVDPHPAKAATFGACFLEDRIFRLQR